LIGKGTIIPPLPAAIAVLAQVIAKIRLSGGNSNDNMDKGISILDGKRYASGIKTAFYVSIFSSGTCYWSLFVTVGCFFHEIVVPLSV
jgi:uncharacterized Fe-S cluster-containing MiaB family protein